MLNRPEWVPPIYSDDMRVLDPKEIQLTVIAIESSSCLDGEELI
jgi:hypothetical protein